MRAKDVLIELFDYFDYLEYHNGRSTILRDDLVRRRNGFLATREMFDYQVEALIEANKAYPGSIRFTKEEGPQFESRSRRLGHYVWNNGQSSPGISDFIAKYPEPIFEKCYPSYADSSLFKGKLESRYLSGRDSLRHCEVNPLGGIDLFYHSSLLNRWQEAGYVWLHPEWESLEPEETCLEILSDPDTWLI